jgi:hypothetical protein
LPIVYSGKVTNPVVDENARINTVPRWFNGIKLNFTETFSMSVTKMVDLPKAQAKKTIRLPVPR